MPGSFPPIITASDKKEKNGYTITPAQLAVYMTIPNHSQYPLTIERIIGESQSWVGWVPLLRMATKTVGRGIYYGYDLSRMSQIHEDLEAAGQNPISPGQSIHGWALFAYPPGVDGTRPMRIEIKTDSSHNFVVDIVNDTSHSSIHPFSIAIGRPYVNLTPYVIIPESSDNTRVIHQ
jgi:hypothetical protein